MKKIISKINFENIFIIYIILQPIIDIITSLCVRNISEQLTFGIFIRTIFMLYVVIYALVKIDKKSKLQLLTYYLLIALYCIGFLISSYTKYGFSMIYTQIKGIVKTFYFPIMLSSLLMIFKNKKYSSKYKYLNLSLAIYVLTIVICKIFSVGYPTYPLKPNTGTIGLFYAGNEISAIIAILSPVCFATFISQKFNIFYAILCAITVFAMLEIGTKVAFISIIGLLTLSLIISIIKLFSKKYKGFYKQFISLAFIGILTILLLGNTSAGKNLGIKPIFVNKNISTEENTTKKTKKKTKKDTTTTLLSNRNTYLKNTFTRYSESSLLEKSTGLGYISPKKNIVQESKLIEIDYFDIFFCHGILGAIIYIIPLAILIFISLKKFFSRFVINIKNYTLILNIYSILIGCGIALMAGHVFTAPAVSMIMILVILEIISLLYYEKDKKNE